MEITGWRGLLRARAAREHDYDAQAGRDPPTGGVGGGADRSGNARDPGCERICRPLNWRIDGAAGERSALPLSERRQRAGGRAGGIFAPDLTGDGTFKATISDLTAGENRSAA